MTSREANAKHLVESIVKDLNTRYNMELFIQRCPQNIMLANGRLCDSLSIKYPDRRLQDGAFTLIRVKDPTYSKLLHAMVKATEMTYYGTDGKANIKLNISKLYGKNANEIHNALMKNAEN